MMQKKVEIELEFIELFAGIGGFRYGLENCRNVLQSKTTKNIQKTMPCVEKGEARFACVFANEWDKYACKIYRKNFGEGELYEGDIRKIPAESIPNHDLLTAGFPCQAFSIAGKRKGFNDTRGTLFFEICRIAEVKKPRLLLLENVKGLLNHKKGETFRIILDSLSELGYDCEWEVFNSKNFGVPHNRERVFIVGHLRGRSGQKIFPIGGIREAPRKQDGIDFKIIHNVYGGFGEKTVREFKKYSPTIRTSKGGGHLPMIVKDNKIRRITPIECERLQGFPDNWTEGISDNQRFKCLGNAVTVNIIAEIGKRIAKVQQGIF
jgi:DNA (cytosine-5)-methyltransferase 1